MCLLLYSQAYNVYFSDLIFKSLLYIFILNMMSVKSLNSETTHKNFSWSQVVQVHACNPSSREAEGSL